MKVSFCLAVALLLSGCATTQNYEKKLQSWVGLPKESLVMSWGVPARTMDMGGGKEALEYVYNGGTTSTYYSSLGMVDSQQNSCSTTFFIDLGVVTNWRYQGNSCRSY